MNELMRRGGVLTLLRGRGRHFKRKSTPQPTTPMARQRPGRYPKLQPRSQSLGSLSVITDARSPARYESITNHHHHHHKHPLRLTASVHYLGEEITLFSTPAPPPLPPLPRTHCSQLCLVGQDNEKVAPSPVPPQPPLVPNLMPHLAVVAVVTNTNNNHIYADLELSSKQTQDAEAGSIASGGVDEVVTCQQVHIEVNCSSTADPADAAQSSIDAHLDRIDELNRVLDDRLKRSLQPQEPLLPNGLNAIESCGVEDRTELNAECQDKRNSSNNSSQLSTGQAKKRSLSFTQKSISNLLTNIKEFSKSPLTRVVKNAALNEEPSEAQASHNNNNQHGSSSIATTSTATTTTTGTGTTTTTTTTPSKESNSRLKFKVPKIQKKSKAIRNTFRTKLLNFQLRHSKTLCKQCTKRRRIHPSKSSFDLAKDFTESGDPQQLQQQEGEQQFCNCPVAVPAKTKTVQMPRSCDDDQDDDEGDGDNSSSDDVLSLKDHCYCVPSLAASVSSSSASGSRSTDRDRAPHRTKIDKEEETAHPATASK